MKVALLLTTYNRPEYLKQCLWSLERADLSKVDTIMVIDDGSTDGETLSLINNTPLIKYKDSFMRLSINRDNKGIKQRLFDGYEHLFRAGFDIVINLDSDAIVRPDFVERLIEVYDKEIGVVTGFNCDTRNANGAERHTLISKKIGYNIRKSVGGINLLTDNAMYEAYIRPSLQEVGNWDANTFIKAGFALSVCPSVIQHIGFNSSMNHTEQPDVADDFYYWDLPDVTLIGVDSNPGRLKKAADKCTKWIKFGAVKLITHSITSKEQYSDFCIKDLYKHVDTSHMLICQHDGYVNNWQAWDNDWLQYDYIGAPWHYNDGMAVGNGGFSLRSRRLMEIVASDRNITQHHPEDHHICRTYRPYLESKYGIKFAPIEVAEKFSFEGYLQPGKVLKDQFGVHGVNPRTIPAVKRDSRYLVGQFRGLGDILFLIPLVRALMEEGNIVMWPIVSEYMSIAKHFPDIPFVNKDKFPLLPYESRQIVDTIYGRWLPYRFAIEIMGRGMKDCMRAKYELYGHNHEMWRSLVWKRDWDAERRLERVLNLPSEYVLVNPYFGEASRCMQIRPDIKTNLPIITMKTIEGFSLIDWCGIIERASEIHTANTSLNYLIELMSIDAPVYVYQRGLWGETAFEHTRDLWRNECWRFVGEGVRV